MASNDRQKHCKPLQIVLRVQLFGNCQLMLQVRMTVFSPAKVQKSPQNVNARPERPKLEARKAKCGGWGWRSWQQAFLLPAKESGGAVSSFSGLRGERQKILILFCLFHIKITPERPKNSRFSFCYGGICRSRTLAALKILSFVSGKNVQDFCHVGRGHEMHQKCMSLTQDPLHLAELSFISL